MAKPSTIFDKFKAIQKIGTTVEVPWNVARCFRSNTKSEISIVGNDICLGEDYVDLSTAREAVEFYVTQLGGKVAWDE